MGKPGRQFSKALFGPDGPYDLAEFEKAFMEIGDIYEYQAAVKLVGTWTEWQRLKRDWKAFAGYVEKWKAELAVKLRSEAALKIKAMSEGSEASALTAAKWIAEGHYDKALKRPIGRPRKKKISEAARELAQQERDADKDLERVQGAAVGKS